MASRTDIIEIPTLTDFVCNQVLTEVQLNNMIDAINGLSQNGDTVFSQVGTKNGGYQKTVVGYAAADPPYSVTGQYVRSNQYKDSLTESVKFENVRWGKYILNLGFRAIQADADLDIGTAFGVAIDFQQAIKVVYKTQAGTTQTIFDSINPIYGTFSYNTFYEVYVKGTINSQTIIGQSNIDQLQMIVSNSNISGKVAPTDPTWFFIDDPEKWGGIKYCSLRLYN